MVLEDGVDPDALTLRALTGLNHDNYLSALLLSGLVRRDENGVVQFIKKEWEQLIDEYVASDGKERHTRIRLPTKCVVLRLGGGKQRGFKNAKECPFGWYDVSAV